MTELFWLVSQEARVRLIQFQAARHKDKPVLDMAHRKAPWELESPTPAIPVHTGMTNEETDRFMRQKPHPGAGVRRG